MGGNGSCSSLKKDDVNLSSDESKLFLKRNSSFNQSIDRLDQIQIQTYLLQSLTCTDNSEALSREVPFQRIIITQEYRDDPSNETCKLNRIQRYFTLNTFRNLKEISLVSLKINNLQFIAFVTIENVTTLKINDNQIISLNTLVKSKFSNIKLLNICDNPMVSVKFNRFHIPKKSIYLVQESKTPKFHNFQDKSSLLKVCPNSISLMGPNPKSNINQTKWKNAIIK